MIYETNRIIRCVKTWKRLNVVQTSFGKDIGFSVRTFRFLDDQPSNDQTQTISCELYLDPSDEASAEQATDCTCYSESECTG